jgi:uncharacterized protein (TIGR02265 family)
MGRPGFTQGSMFEGLYERVLKPEGAFAEDLKVAGYDRSHPLPEYPDAVWVACLNVTAKHRFPLLERHVAWRQIGRLFIGGFLDTLVGKLIGAALPFLSAHSFITRVPRFVSAGLPGVLIGIEWLDAQKARLTLPGPHEGASYVMAGVLDVTLLRFKVTPEIEPALGEGKTSSLVVSWK